MKQDDEEKKSPANSGQVAEGYGTLLPNHHPYEYVIAHVGTSRNRRVDLLIVQGIVWEKVLVQPIPLEERLCERKNIPMLMAGSASDDLHVYGCCLLHITEGILNEVKDAKKREA